MTTSIHQLVRQSEFSKDDIVTLLSVEDAEESKVLQQAAHDMLLSRRGDKVYYRGLIEFSNMCVCDCHYCGIRKSNSNVKRFLLSKEEIVATALWCAENDYGSIVLQSGERRDPAFIDFLCDVTQTIRQQSISEKLPHGLGITLSVGEQSEETYQRLFDAGAHRYLLRIETTSPALFARLHPPTQRLIDRKACLRNLKKIGYRVGTGVMIGLPGQTISELADDILFFRDEGIDMIGMGPYIVHHETPMHIYREQIAFEKKRIFELALKMIAVTRLVLPNINIAATTALQAIHPIGREKGLEHGANVVMPLCTPASVRKQYLLYDDKPCLEDKASQCRDCLKARIRRIGRTVATNEWGDARPFFSSSTV